MCRPRDSSWSTRQEGESDDDVDDNSQSIMQIYYLHIVLVCWDMNSLNKQVVMCVCRCSVNVEVSKAIRRARGVLPLIVSQTNSFETAISAEVEAMITVLEVMLAP